MSPNEVNIRSARCDIRDMYSSYVTSFTDIYIRDELETIVFMMIARGELVGKVSKKTGTSEEQVSEIFRKWYPKFYEYAQERIRNQYGTGILEEYNLPRELLLTLKNSGLYTYSMLISYTNAHGVESIKGITPKGINILKKKFRISESKDKKRFSKERGTDSKSERKTLQTEEGYVCKTSQGYIAEYPLNVSKNLCDAVIFKSEEHVRYYMRDTNEMFSAQKVKVNIVRITTLKEG